MPVAAAPRPWLPVAVPLLAALLLLYVPTFIDLSKTIWKSEEQGHGPLILAVSIWIFWQKRDEFVAAIQDGVRSMSAWVLLVLGLLLYVLGRSQQIILFEVGSQIPLLAGGGAILFGWRAVRVMAFPLLFLVFMVPLPAAVIDSLTGPLKRTVSVVAETILYEVGYPIARSGVVLTIGQYQLLVADACSGLNSMFSLSALGLLYVYLMKHSKPWRNVAIIASILPIAFLANAVRVMILVLVTYHFGDEAGQGFVHGAAGMVLFLIALVLLFSFDGLLGLFDRKPRKSA
ncbi:exosortase B [Aquabacterium sp. A7-Y]|uniref:exosortase B n=1 Tax=Aquabacterium sp. A7-Y TaxID=1349605 RepID=UPI00223CDBD0|nr:exosortase B [Aquabacterium sp. A7-Y]MCW7537309.1 exosortase B [Aquabacterium sp. A7-Y]